MNARKALNELARLKLKEIEKYNKQDLNIDIENILESRRTATKLIDSKYELFTTIFSERLNALHNEEFPREFWQRLFSLQLYRSLFVLYEFKCKIKELSIYGIEIDESINKEFFKTPNNFEDQRQMLVAEPFIQEQLFACLLESQGKKPEKYIRIASYAIDNLAHEKDKLKRVNSLNIITRLNPFRFLKRAVNKTLKVSINRLTSCTVCLNGCLFDHNYRNKIFYKTIGKVRTQEIINIRSSRELEIEKREIITRMSKEMDEFDRFYMTSMKYLLPRIVIEDFKVNLEIFKKRLNSLPSLKFIISEGWTSSTSINLFRVVAKQFRSIPTIANEHNCFVHPFEGSYFRHLTNLVDNYITLGWEPDQVNVIKGASLFQWKVDKVRKQIFPLLYIGYGIHRYSEQDMSTLNIYSEGSAEYALRTHKLFTLLDPHVKANTYYRGYPKDYFIKDILDYSMDDIVANYIQKEKILLSAKIPGYTCKEQMRRSGLVVMSYISTAYLEALHMDIPVVLLWHADMIPLKPKYKDFYDDLIESKVVHTSVESAATHINEVYENPRPWWDNPRNKNLRAKWLTRNFGNPEQLINYVSKLSEMK